MKQEIIESLKSDACSRVRVRVSLETGQPQFRGVGGESQRTQIFASSLSISIHYSYRIVTALESCELPFLKMIMQFVANYSS